jgi:SNF2 family DNA or RNA helicase
VFRQWIEEELPKHLDKRIRWSGVLWKKKKITDFHQRERKGQLTFFAMNTDAVRTKNGYDSAVNFMTAHKGKVMLVVDESQDFKSNGSDRTYNLMKLKELSTFRRIATGTPIAKNVVDVWSQFNFLDLRILGFKYLTAFKQRFCITKPGDNSVIVAHKNIEELYSLIAPHSFRMKQEEAVDLPPKIYVTREYDMGDDTAGYYKQIKETLLAEMADGAFIDAVNPAVALIRLHQVVCGFLPKEPNDEDGKDAKYRFGGERITEMLNIVRQVEGPIVIWARFTEDRKLITEALLKEKETFAVYAGGDDQRAKARKDFLNDNARVFVSNPKTGGVGLNLQGKCGTVIFYSNSFSALDRWQAEGRTYRIGTLGTVTYFDLVARKSVDKTILRNLKVKKDLADLALDDIRRAIIVGE